MRYPSSTGFLAVSLFFALLAASCDSSSELVDGCNDRCAAHHARCQLDPADCTAQCETLTATELTCMENDGCSAEAQASCIASEGACTQPTSQQVSEPCCLALGVDACGAGLVCAAIEGRAQATCYPARSRADMTECTEDRLCASGSCNTSRSVCRSSVGADCDNTIGCADDEWGFKAACEQIDASSRPKCVRSSLPAYAHCIYDQECASHDCYFETCRTSG